MKEEHALLEHERLVLQLLLAGDEPPFPALRDQAARLQVVQRQQTESGFLTALGVHPEVPRLRRPSNFELNDVCGVIEGVKHGARFLLFVRDGALDLLEGIVFHGDAWPAQPVVQRLYYVRHPEPGSRALVESLRRDRAMALEQCGNK